MSIERLAFLAAQPALRRLARPWWLSLLRDAEVYGGPYAGRSVLTAAAVDTKATEAGRVQPPTMAREIGSARMVAYAFACEQVATGLSADERAALRADGSLPSWFLPEVRRVASRVRKKGYGAA